MDERKLRKYRNNLISSGQASIIFSLWSILRFCLFVILNPQEVGKYFEDVQEDEIPVIVIWIAFWAIIILFFLIIFLFHYFVGKSAIIEARKNKDKYVYLIFALLMLALCAFSVNSTVRGKSESTNMDVAAVSVIMDITSMFIYTDIIFSSIVTKVLRHRISR